MKAQLLLKVDKNSEEGDYISLVLSIPNRERFLYDIELKDNLEEYKDSLEQIINESTLWINSIPGLKLVVDQSVTEFLENDEEEIRKFVSMLVTEM